MKKPLVLLYVLSLVLLVVLISWGAPPQPRTNGQTDALLVPTLVVLAERGDPYALLADEIAQAEDAVRLHDLQELAKVDPTYVVYVVSPDWLTEGKLLALSDISVSTGRHPALGIISGSTIEKARALWQRGAEVRPGTGIAASATSKSGGLDEALIWTWTDDPAVTAATQPLTEEALLDALQAADYFHWSRHVGAKTWFWSEGDEVIEDQRLLAREVPPLPPVVVHTPSCRSFVPWTEDSIALAFTDQGAASYLGHLYSPISSGYSIGYVYALPGYDTWPGVPMGVLAQVQNRAAERGYSTQPYLYMLGDPRIAVQPDAPYTITSDETDGHRRVIRGTWESAATSPGVLPLRIPSGAGYRFVQVKGVGAVSDGDPFYHGSIQSLNVQGDKVVLIMHPSGPFEVTLNKRAPLLWRQVDALRDAFEFVWCNIAVMQDPVALVSLALLVVVIVVKVVRKTPLRPTLPALWVGLGWAAVQWAFCLFRAGRVSVVSYRVDPTGAELALAAAGTSTVVAMGLAWMLDARRWVGRVLGLGVCLAPTGLLLGLYTGAVTLLNVAMSQKSPDGIWALNYASVRMAAIVGLVELLVFVSAYRNPGRAKE